MGAEATAYLAGAVPGATLQLSLVLRVQSASRTRRYGAKGHYGTFGNTILVTGGGSGIRRAIAEALHKCGNQIIISGCRKSNLTAVVQLNRGIDAPNSAYKILRASAKWLRT